MLVTTRHIGEAIVINGHIEIIVLGIKGGRVKLGTQAPREVIIDRKEKWARRAPELERAQLPLFKAATMVTPETKVDVSEPEEHYVKT